jgi:enoyl-CoA hydratase
MGVRMAEFENIVYEVEKGRARITLNRPEKRNALSVALLQELCRALWDADDDRNVRGVIVRGAGPSFCAGYDLTDPAAGSTGSESGRGMRKLDDDIWQLERIQRARMALFDMHKPVIAQVHGHCIAGGTDVALLCDMVIAADDAVIGFPPVRDLGSPPNQMWVYHVGPQWAKRLLLTGDTITGREAAEIGLVLKAVRSELLEGEVEGLLDRIALVDEHLLSANKRSVNLALELMGARTMQRLAAELDARAHQAGGLGELGKEIQAKGAQRTFAERRAKFGDGRARVRSAEIRDAEGRLVDDGD